MDVDRPNRDRLTVAMRQYLAEEISAFAFDEEIHRIKAVSNDHTIAFVVDCLWLYYDDVRDHSAMLTQEQWNLFQRLLLVLESDGAIQVHFRKVWCLPQLAAAVALVGFGAVVLHWGIGHHLYSATVPLGVLSMLLSRWRRRCAMPFSTAQEGLVPFSSMAELLTVRRGVAGFAKRRYPHRLGNRRVRSRGEMLLITLSTHLLWLQFSPIVLLLQIRRVHDVQLRVVVP